MISRERLHKANLKAKKRLKIKVPNYWEHKEKGISMFKWQAYRNSGQLCSCTMCGNPRKHFNKKTIQELKIELNE